jgi:hypothetical protein
MFKEVVEHTKYLWAYDRKEFWDTYLSFGLVVFWFWFSLFVLIPIFG